jgi:hypothetical protein
MHITLLRLCMYAVISGSSHYIHVAEAPKAKGAASMYAARVLEPNTDSQDSAQLRLVRSAALCHHRLGLGCRTVTQKKVIYVF